MSDDNRSIKEVLAEGLENEEGETIFGTPDRPKLPLVGSLNIPITKEEENSNEYVDS